jgi:hypothetical protein
MEGRVEYKYLVPNSLQDDIRADLRPFMLADALGGQQRNGEYTVRSIYYDTPRLECYDTKSDGLKDRRKFRIRGYGQPKPDSLVFLEIKRKCAQFIEKHRAPLLHRDLQQFLTSPDLDRYIIQSNGNDKERRDAERFLYHYYRRRLTPAVLVVYDREAFLGRFDPAIRITFDKALRGTPFPLLEDLYDDDGLQPALAHSWIFEVKFFRCALPAFVRSIIRRYQLPRMALSKYAICLDSHPTRPTSSPWRERRFATASRPD